MKIPKRFKLFGQTVEVVFDDNLLDSYDCIGRSSTKFNQIRLQTNIKGINRLQSDIEQVFIHELLHQCLGRMEERELRDNEKFVDILASLIHQALTTAEYEEVNNG